MSSVTPGPKPGSGRIRRSRRIFDGDGFTPLSGVAKTPRGRGRGRGRGRSRGSGISVRGRKSGIARGKSDRPRGGSQSHPRSKPPSDNEDYDGYFMSDEYDEDVETREYLDSESDSDSLGLDEDFLDNVSEVGSASPGLVSRSPSPLPVWLQDRPDLPVLVLPPSSEDLLIETPLVLRALSVYELIMHFSRAFRLSPFRFEDFCAALAAEEQSTLLSEMHMQLLKAILRNCDQQAVTFGAPDLRDVINIDFFFLDCMTWPAVLKSYFESHSKFMDALHIVTEKNYPYCEAEDRLVVLEALVDELMLSNSVRDQVNNYDGKIPHEDHCRGCQTLGELLCCDTCTAVYHLGCSQPPLLDVPTESWQCPICVAEKRLFDLKVAGVTDCVSLGDRLSIRQEPLGYDRHGRKYWFLCRRLLVENESTGEVWYYSTETQLDELLYVVDPDDLEAQLCERIITVNETLREQMRITFEITERHKVHGKQVYLNLEIDESKKRIEDLKYVAEKAAEEKAQQAAAKAAEAMEAEQVLAAAQLEELNVFSQESGEGQSSEGVSSRVEPSAQGVKSAEIPKVGGMLTRIKTGTIMPTKYAVEDGKSSSKPSSQRVDLSRPKLGSGPYKLGMEGNHKHYINQYTSNPLALSKQQHQEEKDRRTQLARKFALNQAKEFEWTGVVNGSENMSIQTLRQTVLNLQQQIADPFVIPNWPKVHPTWNKLIRDANAVSHFRLTLTVLAQCVKTPVLMSVWNEGGGHTRLVMETVTDREQQKKREKKEARAREAMEEFSKIQGTYVKYTLGLKHQVARLKGEDYRVHGNGGWCWVSKSRMKRSLDARTCGLRKGPHKCIVQTSGGLECVTTDEIEKRLARFPDALILPPASRLPDDAMDDIGDIFSPEDDEAEKEESAHGILKAKSLESSLTREKLITLLPPVNPSLLGIVDVSAALSDELPEGGVDAENAERRSLYPKYGRTGVLDGLLSARRLQMAEANEVVERLIIRKDPSAITALLEAEDSRKDEPIPLPDIEVEDDEVRDALQFLRDSNSGPDNQAGFQRILELGKETYPWLSLHFTCYSPNCQMPRGKSAPPPPPGTPLCYSTGCRKRMECHRRLADLKKALMVIKEHRDKNKAEQAVREAQRQERRRKIIDADPGPEDIIVYQCKTKVTLRADVLTDEFPAKRKLDKKKTSGGISNSLIPLTSRFKGANSVSNLLLPPKYEVRRCSRRKGKFNFSGFLYSAKQFPLHYWPYPCPRPSFKTTWLWHCSRMRSVHEAALQTRLLWACVRWDSMSMRPPADARAFAPQVMTDDNDIIRTEILDKRTSGEFNEKTQYLVRKVVIPVDTPKASVREIPSRLGLRTRRSQLTENLNQSPTVVEDWVFEDALELWEIKRFHEGLEKASHLLKLKEKGQHFIDQQTLLMGEKRAKLEKENALKVERDEKRREEMGWAGSAAKLAVLSASKDANVSLLTESGSPTLSTIAPDGTKRPNAEMNAMFEETLKLQRLKRKRLGGEPQYSTSPALMEMRKRESGGEGDFLAFCRNVAQKEGLSESKVNQTDGNKVARPPTANLSSTRIVQLGDKKGWVIRGPPPAGLGKSIPRLVMQGSQPGSPARLIVRQNKTVLLKPDMPSPVQPQLETDQQNTNEVVVSSALAEPEASNALSGQRVAFTPLPDGRMGVVSLIPGQQIVKAADGTLHLVLNAQSAGTQETTISMDDGSHVEVPHYDPNFGHTEGGDGEALHDSLLGSSGHVMVQNQVLHQEQLLQPGEELLSVGTEQLVDESQQSLLTMSGLSQNSPLNIHREVPNSQSSFSRGDHGFAAIKSKARSRNKQTGPIVRIVPGPNEPTVLCDVTLTAQQKIALRALLPDSMKTVQNTNQSIYIQLPPAQVLRPSTGGQTNPLLSEATRKKIPGVSEDDNQAQACVDENDLQAALESITRFPVRNRQKPKRPQIQKRGSLGEDHPFGSSKRQDHFVPDVVEHQPRASELMPPVVDMPMDSREFIVTSDYVKQTIQAALKQSNLSDGMAKKLHAMQKMQAEKDAVAAATMATVQKTSDEDYDHFGELGTPKKVAAKRKAPEPSPSPRKRVLVEKVKNSQPDREMLAVKTDELRKEIVRKRSQWNYALKKKYAKRVLDMEMSSDEEKKKPSAARLPVSSPAKKQLSFSPRHRISSPPPPQPPTAKSPRREDKKFVEKLNKLAKDGRKRKPSVSESDREILKKPKLSPKSSPSASGVESNLVDWSIRGKTKATAPKMKNTEALAAKYRKKVGRKRKSDDDKSKSFSDKKAGRNKEELFCLCKTPYDNQKFYIGCDFCENWYHGSCINVTPAQATTMKQYKCPECQAKETKPVASKSPAVPEKDAKTPKSTKKIKSENESEPETKPTPATSSRKTKPPAKYTSVPESSPNPRTPKQKVKTESVQNGAVSSKSKGKSPMLTSAKASPLIKTEKKPQKQTKVEAKSAKKDSTPVASRGGTKDSVKSKSALKDTAKSSSKKDVKKGKKKQDADSESDEVYCTCRKPYEPTKFYICCDECGDWLHGTCVGILACEAENIKRYLCPSCGPKTPLNSVNFSRLKQNTLDELKAFILDIKKLKHADPFLELDFKKEPVYKKIISEPMDLKTIEDRLNEGEYLKLKDFIADLVRIFSNCRIFYPDTSERFQAATKLEGDVSKKIKAFRRKIARSLNLDASGL
ncbi:unnamed protein product [Notodromas monacha]|uniref:Uncharacterized protein n=1 Tax=Notodromas monacha TaxID=399045 RepID=A0A7R9GGY6_9CRUS|nr:unnamed protein product [Notodromas monacha]CAG0922204.1 unnamed protein product [Notodromas monacha]